MRQASAGVRAVHDFVRARSPSGTHARVPLRNGTSFGAVQSRGDRLHQEDTYSVSCVQLPCEQLRQDVGRCTRPDDAARAPWNSWSCEQAGGEELGGQVVWAACFDGHGGGSVSALLRDKLQRIFEAVEPDMVTDTVEYTRSIGGYFRRFNGGVLEPWVRRDVLKPPPPRLPRQPPKKEAAPSEEVPKTLAELVQGANRPTPALHHAERETEPPLSHFVALPEDALSDQPTTRRIEPPKEMRGRLLTMEQRATLACLMLDREVQQNPQYRGAGSTASVLCMHSLDAPSAPWYDSEFVAVTSIHLGDTRFLLCSTADGTAVPLTRAHHPDEESESARLRRVGAAVVTDSFGEVRFMGQVANTRAFGDTAYKRLGVTAEPEVVSHVIEGDAFAFAIGFSDGVSDVLTDQEIVDLCRGAGHPSEAARRVINFAEDVGSEDNCTAICVPLRGWGKIGGQDTTRDRREYRLSVSEVNRRDLR